MTDTLLRTTHLADAADQLGCGEAAGLGNLAWLGRPGAMAIGRAFTIQQRAVAYQGGTPPLDTRQGEVAGQLLGAGELLVIDVDGETLGATWGEAQTLRAINANAAGVLMYGYTRDIDGMRERGFPVLCRGGSPFRSLGRMQTVDIRCDLDIAGVRVRHGDTVAIDADGFVCIPAEHAETVIARAKEIALKEQERDRQLSAGAMMASKETGC